MFIGNGEPDNDLAEVATKEAFDVISPTLGSDEARIKRSGANLPMNFSYPVLKEDVKKLTLTFLEMILTPHHLYLLRISLIMMLLTMGLNNKYESQTEKLLHPESLTKLKTKGHKHNINQIRSASEKHEAPPIFVCKEGQGQQEELDPGDQVVQAPVVVKTYKLYIHTIQFCTQDLVIRSEDFP